MPKRVNYSGSSQTKDALNRYPWLTESIERYLSEKMIETSRPTVFTYKDVEETFRNNFITAHFGDIKGRNIYKSASMIAQVGLNRYDETYYIALGIYSDSERIRHIAQITDLAEQGGVIDRILNESGHFHNIMNRVIAADIEQNLFRGCIRDPYSGVNYKYFVVYDFNSSDISGLVRILKERYKALGATVVHIPEPNEIKEIRKQPWASERITRKKLVLEWVDIVRKISPGRVFRIKEMLKEISVNSSRTEEQMTSKQFQKLKDKYPEIKKLFGVMRIGKTQKYKIPD